FFNAKAAKDGFRFFQQSGAFKFKWPDEPDFKIDLSLLGPLTNPQQALEPFSNADTSDACHSQRSTDFCRTFGIGKKISVGSIGNQEDSLGIVTSLCIALLDFSASSNDKMCKMPCFDFVHVFWRQLLLIWQPGFFHPLLNLGEIIFGMSRTTLQNQHMSAV